MHLLGDTNRTRMIDLDVLLIGNVALHVLLID